MKFERLKRGWNQTTLAYRAKVAISEISRIETRRTEPVMSHESAEGP